MRKRLAEQRRGRHHTPDGTEPEGGGGGKSPKPEAIYSNPIARASEPKAFVSGEAEPSATTGTNNLRHRTSSAPQSDGGDDKVASLPHEGSLEPAGSSQAPTPATLDKNSWRPQRVSRMSRSQTLTLGQAEAADLAHMIDGDWGKKGVSKLSQDPSAQVLCASNKSRKSKRSSRPNADATVSNMEAGLVQGQVVPEAAGGADGAEPGAPQQESPTDEEVVAGSDVSVDLEWDAGEGLGSLLMPDSRLRFLLSLLCPLRCCLDPLQSMIE